MMSPREHDGDSKHDTQTIQRKVKAPQPPHCRRQRGDTGLGPIVGVMDVVVGDYVVGQ